MNKIKDDAEIPKSFRALHGLHHVYASMLASSGKVDMYTLQKLLTHKSPQMTQRYAHLRDETVQSASDLAGEIIGDAMKKSDDNFVLTKEEFENLRCQIDTSSWGGTRYMPMVFTEQGVAMLSSVLSSKLAIQVNIQIMRAFTKLREMLSSYDELRAKIEAMEAKYDDHFQVVFNAIKSLIETEDSQKPQIGF